MGVGSWQARWKKVAVIKARGNQCTDKNFSSEERVDLGDTVI